MNIPNFLPIPEWDEEGFLPSHLGPPNQSASHPPYRVRLTDLMSRLGQSARRETILKGFLTFRSELHKAGLTRGLQWIDGSFVNDKMKQRGEEPNDIDVVTLFYVPAGTTQIQLLSQFPDLLADQVNANKEKYNVDSYFVSLSSNNPDFMTKSIAFWNNLWHHTEQGRRKGFLAVDLADGEDEEAWGLLANLASVGHDVQG